MTGGSGQERLRKVTHRGRSILLTDYSGFIKWNDWRALIEAEMRLMPREPLGSVRALAVFTGSRFSDEVFEAITKLALANRPYIKASALVGLSPLQRAIFLKGIERRSSRDFGVFDTVEEALDWLAEQE
ncbi:MAG: hypothetical protein H0W29_00060 [Gemmatimonadales bacterium]|nr:hypothetical protein [Gemmatimonadales bacterium]